MAQTDYSVVSKGEYESSRGSCQVYPKQYVVLKNSKKEKFLSLRFFNGLSLSVTYLEFILFQLDSAGNVIKRSRIREDISRGAANRTFSIPSGIKLSDKCVDFKIQMVKARCGKYAYSLKSKNSYPVYLLDYKWKYDMDNQGFFASQTVKSRMKGDFPLVKLLVVVMLILAVVISFYPIISYLLELYR